MNLNGRKVLVIGLARTGRESARFLLRQGAKVLVSDLRSESELRQEIDALAGNPIEYFCGGEQTQWLDGVDWVIPSPGVPARSLLLSEAQRRGIGIVSEIELAYRFLSAPLVAITGTNGKSTTTTLVGAMLKAKGSEVFIGGNIGMPLIGFVDGRWEWGVVEISSFQLEWTEKFCPRIAVLLNVTEDHLDRYADLAAYAAAKEKIFQAQGPEGVAVLNRDDARVWAMKERVRSRVVSFGATEVSQGVFSAGDEIVWREQNYEERFSLREVKLRGVHNVENMMAAVAVVKSLGVARDIIQKALDDFPGLEHRLEFVREKDGVDYYNDSKGTNVGAVVKSLASFDAPVILIAGGVDKGGSYGPLREGIERKVKRLILFGAAKDLMAKALGEFANTVLVDTLGTAVSEAAAHARAGDIVLLSPACSSFDMFKDYAERGRIFKELVRAL
jgi:UDP-N-acetylmuramoylalanine--D-glutamate ligase